tara:strand:+ start:176 stop:427 length:252 start_codon:yes stop_codon:yes gene_type:complete
MTSSRKIKRRKELQARKKSKKVLKEVTKNIDRMPKFCSKCGIEFDKTVNSNLDEWRIQIYETGRVVLTCGNCQVLNEQTEVSE